MAPPKIVIIGAGPAGATFARLLQKNLIPCTIFEAEPHRHSRNQGGSLDLHPKAGQLALAEAGLTDEFRKHARPEGECLKLLDSKGNVLWDENVTGTLRPVDESDRPEIDRTALRDLLLDSLEPDTVRWGRKIERAEVEAGSKGTHTIYFAGGTKETGIDLLVGADGAFSKIRPLVTPAQPEYSGITAMEQWKMDVEKTDPWLHNYIGAGSCFMFDEGRALMCQRQGDRSLRCYTCVRQPLSWSKECGIDWSDDAVARRSLAENCFGDCGEDVKRTILEMDDYVTLRHMWMLPVGLKWEAKPGVTLLGDAAHLMTPFGGVGVNVAMADALDLAQRIIARRDSFLAKALSDNRNIMIAIQEYEKSMFVRAEENAQKTYKGLQHHFRSTGSQEWADRFHAHVKAMEAEKSSS